MAMRQVNAELAKVAHAPLWPLSEDELTEVLKAAQHAGQIAAAVRLRVAREAENRGMPRVQGHPSLARWLRSQLVLDSRPAREMAEHALALGDRPGVEDALIDGRVDERQAAVIAEAVNDVPGTLADADIPLQPGLQELAEDTLIERAAEFSPFYLRKIGDRILAHVAPEIAERVEEEALRRQEERAHAQRSLTLSAPFGGLVRLTGVLGVEDAAVLEAALQPLCTPISGDECSPAQRRADALVAVCRLALRTGELPEHGGEPAQLTVTVPYDSLTRTLGTAGLDNGDRIPATTVRRLACDARLLPVVLGTAGQVLDTGRTRRLVTTSLRRALTARDRGCAFPGCDRPPRWTDAHHIVSWESGGATCLDNTVLLCGPHHRLIHCPAAGWQVRLGADRLPEFLPPASLDPDRLPRRNLFHPRN
ncbi:HNH endonuclease signature motif containing protein [Actinoplanes sp. N902-109]|uniref:HNH endonuclease signature motif containing protein n=1 Tax=Actinoplanes sp. (strain N902-109) TaxID=649831 RepID=UPI000329518F|nr:HNH endonuclease signature motif containing protein [Actinoplanes sp. N902-109]AGL19643.1 hypothetical protein L083_6133 [Actinoplanes sp. N902-109]